ncbi:MAG TPA: hypothetical protein VFE58_05780 [Tepidisphaeraceae bacterium]|jgi:hypothetical protein|nr:hypothetical protein [Tepidisphaeraceae bacterium]
MTELNPDLEKLQAILIGTIVKLNDQIGSAPDELTVDALTTEIAEVGHRITILGNVLFSAATKNTADAVAEITAVQNNVQLAIRQIESVTDTVNAITPLLELVDQAIDAAKLFVA